MANSILAKMAVQITANNAQFLSELQKTNRAITGFQGGLKNLSNSLGLAFGGAALIGGVRSALTVITEFESSMSEVKAITGATGNEFDALRNDALKLGAATKFSAKEVSGLQVAYGRLGFTTKEILNATKATLDLAAATGEDLSKSADIAGSTIRAFGKDASETQKVADIMASSFNKSALGLENFGEAMKYVAPVAANANISLEQTTALLGVLADAGIRGSQAGTSLRKIISDLGQGAGPILTKRLKEMAAAGLSGADAMSEVGRTAYASLLILSQNTDKVEEMTKVYSEASGEVAKMAEIMQDNLQGDVTKMTRAFQGLILEGSSLIGIFRSIVQSITTITNAVSNLGSELALIGQAISPFRDLAGVSDKTKEYLLNNGRTDTGKDVRDVLKPITGQSNDEFFKNVNQNLRDFITILRQEGESVKDATTLWQYYLKTRIEAKNAETSGASDQRFKEVMDEKGAAVTRFAQAVKVSVAEVKKYSTVDFSVVSELDNLTKAFTRFSEAMYGTGDIKMPDFGEFMKKFKLPKTDEIAEFKNFTIEFGSLISGLAEDFGEFIADFSSGVENMAPIGERIKGVIGGFMKSIGSAMIAFGTAQLVLQFSMNPYAAIAAGIALVAAGAALSKSASNAKRAISGGGGGGNSGSQPRGIDSMRSGDLYIEVGGEFKLSGANLVASVEKQNYKTKRGGG